MEEILASIRKIIEDSDTTRPDVVIAPVQRESADVRAFPRAPNPLPADIEEYAGEEAAAEESQTTLTPVNLNEGPAKGGASVPQSFADDDWELEEELKAAALEPSDLHADLGQKEDSDDGAPAFRPLLGQEAGGKDDASEFGASQPKPQATVAPEAKTIVSSSTVRQVAAAFDDLNQAVAAERRRSFDEIAEEMMRPMLQEWLDDNLPRLVERLVREEIQRVVRGTRN